MIAGWTERITSYLQETGYEDTSCEQSVPLVVDLYVHLSEV